MTKARLDKLTYSPADYYLSLCYFILELLEETVRPTSEAKISKCTLVWVILRGYIRPNIPTELLMENSVRVKISYHVLALYYNVCHPSWTKHNLVPIQKSITINFV